MSQHILKSYDTDLEELKSLVIEMMEIDLKQLDLAYHLFSKDRESSITEKIVANDDVINNLDVKIIDKSITILSLRNPVAYDLRLVFSASHLSRNLERIGDNIKHIARYSTNAELNKEIEVKLLECVHLLTEMLRDTIKAFSTLDETLAKDIIQKDLEVDKLYNDIFNLLLSSTVYQSQEKTEAMNSILYNNLLISRYLERIGDYIVNICRYVGFINNNEVLYG